MLHPTHELEPPANPARFNGMLRTEWRVLFHLGQHGQMTATEICDQAALHKTKVSRAVTALEQKRFLRRETMEQDRRSERLALTKAGRAAFDTLAKAASAYDAKLETVMGDADIARMKQLLTSLIAEQTKRS